MATRLGVNIDHVATLREARKIEYPDPVNAAFLAEQGGADGIVVHLREDRRHINERDLKLLKETVKTHLNLEMAGVQEIVRRTCPAAAASHESGLEWCAVRGLVEELLRLDSRCSGSVALGTRGAECAGRSHGSDRAHEPAAAKRSFLLLHLSISHQTAYTFD